LYDEEKRRTNALLFRFFIKLLGRPADALASYEKALALKPDYVALAIKPDYVDALCNRGNALVDLKRPADALASCDKALAIKPDYVEALNNLRQRSFCSWTW
jgi:tetratricopeptide (TPR) repeat protein